MKFEGEAAINFLKERDLRTGSSHFVEREGRSVYVRDTGQSKVTSSRAYSADEVMKMALAAGVAWSEDFAQPEPRVLEWRMSDERVDRYGDIIRQQYSMDYFNANPVLLDSHASYASLSIVGNVIRTSIEQVTGPGSYSGPALMGLLLFAPESVNPHGDSLYRLAKARLLRAGSIGFNPLVINQIEDPAERARLGLGRYGVVFERVELVEFSLCAVPANAGAIQRAVKSGRITVPDLKTLNARTEAVDPATAIAELQRDVSLLASTMRNFASSMGEFVEQVRSLIDHGPSSSSVEEDDEGSLNDDLAGDLPAIGLDLGDGDED